MITVTFTKYFAILCRLYLQYRKKRNSFCEYVQSLRPLVRFSKRLKFTFLINEESFHNVYIQAMNIWPNRSSVQTN